MTADQMTDRAAACVRQYLEFAGGCGDRRPVMAHVLFHLDGGGVIPFIVSPMRYAADGPVPDDGRRPALFDAATVGRIHELCHVAAVRPVELFKLSGMNGGLNTGDIAADAVGVRCVELVVGFAAGG